jgi:hypothetical protein
VTSLEGIPTAHLDADHGADLVFRPDALQERAVVTLPNSRIGMDCPTVLYVSGPIYLADRAVNFETELSLNVAERRYMVKTLRLSTWEGEIRPDLVREIRWGQVFAGALSVLGRVVTVDENGDVERIHKGLRTLSGEETVGALWLQARLAGLDPNKHIADQLGISPAAAAARVKRARDHELIPPATQGQRR